MKLAFTLITVVCLMASCSRSGTTIANDDSVFSNSGSTPVAATEKPFTEYPISEKALPQEVRNAFYSRFASPQNAQWVLMSRDGNFKVEFFIGKTKWQMVYAPNGTVVSEWHS